MGDTAMQLISTLEIILENVEMISGLLDNIEDERKNSENIDEISDTKNFEKIEKLWNKIDYKINDLSYEFTKLKF